jgi:osmotically-inducible protein OsmY
LRLNRRRIVSAVSLDHNAAPARYVLTSRESCSREGDTEMSSFGIAVSTDRGIIYLSGRVDTQTQREEAERMAWTTAGVRQVVNNIQVGSSIY